MTRALLLVLSLISISAKGACESALLPREIGRLLKSATAHRILSIDRLQEMAASEKPLDPFQGQTLKPESTAYAARFRTWQMRPPGQKAWLEIQREIRAILDEASLDETARARSSDNTQMIMVNEPTPSVKIEGSDISGHYWDTESKTLHLLDKKPYNGPSQVLGFKVVVHPVDYQGKESRHMVKAEWAKAANGTVFALYGIAWNYRLYNATKQSYLINTRPNEGNRDRELLITPKGQTFVSIMESVFEVSGKDMKPILTSTREHAPKLKMAKDGTVYIADCAQIYRIENGKPHPVFDLSQNPQVATGCSDILPLEDGTLLLAYESASGYVVQRATKDKLTTLAVLRGDQKNAEFEWHRSNSGRDLLAVRTKSYFSLFEPAKSQEPLAQANRESSSDNWERPVFFDFGPHSYVVSSRFNAVVLSTRLDFPIYEQEIPAEGNVGWMANDKGLFLSVETGISFEVFQILRGVSK